MAKQIVARDFSHYARRFVRGQEVDGGEFAPDVLKAFQEQGKLIPASSDRASDLVNDPSVIRMRENTAQARAIAQGEEANDNSKQQSKGNS